MLNKLDWCGYSLTITGLILNSNQIIWCWPVWILSNIAWISYFLFIQKNKKTEWAVIFLNITLAAVNIYGWYQWYHL